MKVSRQRRIARILNSRGETPVHELAQELGVSEMTIRRDLSELAARGEIIRTHGGASATGRVSFDFRFLRRAQEKRAEKESIAAVACGLVEDGMSVMLDSGTTTLAIALGLRARRGVTVITTSLPIASALQFSEDLQVLLLGGFLREGAPDLGGALTEANLENLRADLAIVGADGIDRAGGVYNDSLEVGRMLTKMAAAAQRVYVAADHSKLGRTALARFGALGAWDGLITDMGADSAVVRRLRRQGIHVECAPPVRQRSQAVDTDRPD